MEKQKGIVTVIFGPNGSGKTQYVEQMRRQMACEGVRYLAFSDAYGPATDRAYYLQLRWNQHDIDQETPVVAGLLERAYMAAGCDTSERRNMRDELYQMFDMQSLLNKYIILLSSGELRKFQLIKVLLSHPHTLILDNPFIGLDAQTRQQLRWLLYKLAKEKNLHLYLILSKHDDVPDYADDVITVGQAEPYSAPSLLKELLTLPQRSTDYQAETIIDMHHVSIKYDNRVILQDLDWQVKNGEHWALSGENGSGKSTLLSLVCADNPQSYACNINLFGRQRGSGESIWEIKRHIGYVSPEMHRSYQRALPTINVVASGLKDTVGLYVHPNAEEKKTCRWWMRLFGIEQLADRSFLQISSGEQRLALLARAFVKDPELLILDEPLHGLDDNNRQLVREVIDTFCQRKGKTLVMVTHYEEELPQCIDHWLHLTHTEH